MRARAVCCVCKKFLHWAETFDGSDTHGYCPKHLGEVMREADAYVRRDQALRQQEEPAG